MPCSLLSPSLGSASSPCMCRLSCLSFPICLAGEGSAKTAGAAAGRAPAGSPRVRLWGWGTCWGAFSPGAGSLGALRFPKGRDILPGGFSGEGTHRVYPATSWACSASFGVWEREMLWFVFCRVSGFPFALRDGDDGAGGVPQGARVPSCRGLFFGDPPCSTFTPCLQHLVSPACHAASHWVPGGVSGEGPLSPGSGGSPELAASGMTLLESIFRWGASSDGEHPPAQQSGTGSARGRGPGHSTRSSAPPAPSSSPMPKPAPAWWLQPRPRCVTSFMPLHVD